MRSSLLKYLHHKICSHKSAASSVGPVTSLCVRQHSVILNDIAFQLHLHAYDLSFASTFGWMSRMSLTSFRTVVSIEEDAGITLPL